MKRIDDLTYLYLYAICSYLLLNTCGCMLKSTRDDTCRPVFVGDNLADQTAIEMLMEDKGGTSEKIVGLL
jgi:hypothetical protein